MYINNVFKVSTSNKTEMETVKNFYINKLSCACTPRLDKAIGVVIK